MYNNNCYELIYTRSCLCSFLIKKGSNILFCIICIFSNAGGINIKGLLCVFKKSYIRDENDPFSE